ncbi:hypothetical protein EON66_00160 [archaeon]|nr:MAG: hypothetical protein EON66_00160 [archaeon]
MQSLLSESELDAAFHRIEQERNAKNAEAAENNEAAVRRVLEGYGVRRTVEGAGAAVTNVVSGDKYRLPLPTALQQPPRVNLASSSGTKEAGATLAALSDPPLPPVFQRTPDGGYKSRGKILRVVRTTVDKEGQQVVYVTYSVNPYLLKQVWLKQHFGVDLGLLRFPFKPGHRKTVTPFDNVLDPDRTGLVATGIFPSPIASMFMQKQAEMQRTILRKHANSTKFNMWGIGVGNARSSITIHGTEVPACSRCKLWGHASGKASMCPVPAQGTHRCHAAATQLPRGCFTALSCVHAHVPCCWIPPAMQVTRRRPACPATMQTRTSPRRMACSSAQMGR